MQQAFTTVAIAVIEAEAGFHGDVICLLYPGQVTIHALGVTRNRLTEIHIHPIVQEQATQSLSDYWHRHTR